eukprot:8754795-Heterocapsa_arctica.AAC.1
MAMRDRKRVLAPSEAEQDSRCRVHQRVAFMVSRSEYIDARQLKEREKGREIYRSRLPPGSAKDYDTAMLK